jgi:predicted dienelactone hydrolase
MVQLWYPARDEPSAPRAPYLAAGAEVTAALADFLGVAPASLEPLARMTGNAVERAPVADADAFPVLIMLVGIKGSYRQIQTFQAEELASHGYVVAALEQPYTAAMVVFPDGRRVPYDTRWEPPHSEFMDAHLAYLARDVSFVVDELGALIRRGPADLLTGRLDLDRVGVIGHSFGAIVAAQACHREPRLRAALLEDAFMPSDVMHDGLRQPLLFLTRPAESMRLERQVAGGWSEAEIDETLTTMRYVYEHSVEDAYFVQVPGMFHLDMADAPMLADLVPWPGLSGPIRGGRAHEIVNAYSRAFFDRELRALPTPLLDGPSPCFPEVQFESR